MPPDAIVSILDHPISTGLQNFARGHPMNYGTQENLRSRAAPADLPRGEHATATSSRKTHYENTHQQEPESWSMLSES
eukprot:COSAG02_NODE_3915_length_6050_cov_22.279281_7_plen_78_part_00